MSGHKRINAKPICPQDETTTPRKSPRLAQPKSVTPKAKRERISSPVPTVLYDDEVGKAEEDEREARFPTPTSSRLSRTNTFLTFTRSLKLDKPLASMFALTGSQVDPVQKRAGEMGLFSGTVHKPKMLKEEQSEHYLVMGRDASAVDKLLEYQERDLARQLRFPGDMETPVKERSRGLGFFQVVFAGAVGGFAMYYCLIML